jgi:hypothetical protein
MFGQGFALPMPSAAQWRIAAALIVSFSLIGFFVWQPFGGRGFGGVVQASEGAVYRVADEDSRAINSGDDVRASESIRTGREAHAVVRLDDGSTLEMRERSQFSLSERSSAATVNVERGSFIVQMPTENSKTLYVATNDSLTSAKGATFSVASGTKGTRISVISGTATVDANGVSKNLGAGEQFTTRDNLETSRCTRRAMEPRSSAVHTHARHLQATRAAINSRATRPGVRTSTRLLDLAPPTQLFMPPCRIGAHD